MKPLLSLLPFRPSRRHPLELEAAATLAQVPKETRRLFLQQLLQKECGLRTQLLKPAPHQEIRFQHQQQVSPRRLRLAPLLFLLLQVDSLVKEVQGEEDEPIRQILVLNQPKKHLRLVAMETLRGKREALDLPLPLLMSQLLQVNHHLVHKLAEDLHPEPKLHPFHLFLLLILRLKL